MPDTHTNRGHAHYSTTIITTITINITTTTTTAHPTTTHTQAHVEPHEETASRGKVPINAHPTYTGTHTQIYTYTHTLTHALKHTPSSAVIPTCNRKSAEAEERLRQKEAAAKLEQDIVMLRTCNELLRCMHARFSYCRPPLLVCCGCGGNNDSIVPQMDGDRGGMN